MKQWLIPPFRDNARSQYNKEDINRVHSSVRHVVERAIGHLKQHFRRLQEITIHSPNEIVKNNCILHNLCILHEDCVEEFLTDSYDGDSYSNNIPNIYADGQNGIQENLFRNKVNFSSKQINK